ncbi:MAG: site-specific integrase [Planctomycetota bacterium]|nr:site-specific integrase [Planctomycetota bacterium]
MPSSYLKRQTPITKRMAEDMLVRNLAVRTIDTYTYHVDRFARHFGKLPEDLGPEQIREFQLWLIQVNNASWSQFNQAVCSLRFLYTVTIPRPWSVAMIPFGKRPTGRESSAVNNSLLTLDSQLSSLDAQPTSTRSGCS